jgi:hypothetical protein
VSSSKPAPSRSVRLLWSGAALLAVLGVVAAGIAGARLAQAGGFPLGRHDSAGQGPHFWNMPERALADTHAAVTDSRSFYLGDAVVMPNGLKLQVTRVQRNWQPSAIATATYGSIQTGDNPAGREVIAVWFTATDVGSSPILYADTLFTLRRPGTVEQRVARLASLLLSDYGSQGAQPWLVPGQTMATFELRP